MKTTRVIVFFIIILNTLSAYGQPLFVKVDSLVQQKATLPNKMVIGEMHQVSGTYKAYENIIRSLDLTRQYKLVLERSVSFSFMINEFLSGADTSLVNVIQFHNEEERAFYKAVFALNKTLEPSQKIVTIGIDLEFQLNYAHSLAALTYYLPKTSFLIAEPNIQTILSDSLHVNSTKLVKLLSLVDTSKLNSNRFDTIVKAIWNNAQNTLKISHASSLSWGRKREHFLLKNYVDLTSFVKHFIFIVGVAHLPNNTIYPSFTKKLAKDEVDTLTFYYPIYFNHVANKYLEQKYYCEHQNDPLKNDLKRFTYFDTHEGAWILLIEKVKYLIVSN